MVRVELDALERADRIAPEGQWSLGRDRGIKLPQRSGRRIARVHIDGEPGVETLLVETLERLERDVALTAHLDQRRRVRIIERQRYRPDRADVGRDVLAALAVAAGDGSLEQPVAVDERQRESVDLRLDDEHGLALVPGLGELLLEALVPGEELVVVARVGERQHRPQVRRLGEARCDPAADPLRGRVGSYEGGIRRLELA